MMTRMAQIQSGENTHHQDQAITSQRRMMTKIIVSKTGREIFMVYWFKKNYSYICI